MVEVLVLIALCQRIVIALLVAKWMFQQASDAGLIVGQCWPASAQNWASIECLFGGQVCHHQLFLGCQLVWTSVTDVACDWPNCSRLTYDACDWPGVPVRWVVIGCCSLDWKLYAGWLFWWLCETVIPNITEACKSCVFTTLCPSNGGHEATETRNLQISDTGAIVSCRSKSDSRELCQWH